MAMEVRHFTDLEVWRRSHGLFIELVQDIEAMPRRRSAFILADQSVRSLGSVGANIAEGFNRSKAKYLNSLDIALGELNESENWFYKLRDVEYIKRDRANGLVRECVELEKMLNALMRAIRAK